MLAAAAGSSFRIPYGGRAQLQYAKDVARAFILASRATAEGATVHDPPGEVASIGEIVAAIHAVAPDSAGRVTYDDVPPMGVPEQGDSRSFAALLGTLEVTPLATGVAQTVDRFRELLAKGLVQPEGASA
jgi:nucleoside-diphosphate-sugar epimerase